MANHKFIFYSWQSDTPSSVNRSFIEKATREALNLLKDDAELFEAIRDQDFTLDKDTSGVPGSPPIAQTILSKIDRCSVFIADLTFVGESTDSLKTSTKRPQQFPNPNVLIEYGYALKTHSHSAIVAVVNTAFGGDLETDLPFDLKHMRWPIPYDLASSTDPERATKQKRLAKQLAERLKPILLAGQDFPVSIAIPHHEPEPATESDPAVFCTVDRDLVPERSFQSEFVPFSIVNEGRLFFRMFPLYKVEPIRSSVEAVKIAKQSRLWPIGRNVQGCDKNRNLFGAIIHPSLEKGNLFNFTQLFKSWELWGMDGFSVNKSICKAFTEGRHPGYIPGELVEEAFVAAAISFMDFYRRHLPACLEFGIKCGLSGIKGYPIANEQGVFGQSFSDNIIWDTEFRIGVEPADELLKPFFVHMWEECGISRNEATAERLKRFTEKEKRSFE